MKQENPKSQKIIKKMVKTAKKTKVSLSLYQLTLLGVMVCSLWGAKEVKESIDTYNAFETVREDTRDILSSHSDRVWNEDKTEKVHQYDHYGIAKEIQDYKKIHGDVYKEALVAQIMNSITESEYQNMDRIVSYLENVENKEEYIHFQGYETEKDYLKAVKDNMLQEQKEEKVREKYFNENYESRGL